AQDLRRDDEPRWKTGARYDARPDEDLPETQAFVLPLPRRPAGHCGQNCPAAGHPGSGTRLKPSYFHILSIGICSAAELAARATRYRCPLMTSDSLHRDKPAPLRLVSKATHPPPDARTVRRAEECTELRHRQPICPAYHRL